MRKLLCALIALCLLLAGCAGGDAANKLTAVFFNVGKADAILLYNGEMAALIDAGENGDGKDVAEAIRARGIERLDLLIITHFDKDHVGGADKILENIEVGRVLEPDYDKDSKQYRQYREALEEQGVGAEALCENTSFTLGGCEFSIDVANRDDYGEDEENDFSSSCASPTGGALPLRRRRRKRPPCRTARRGRPCKRRTQSAPPRPLCGRRRRLLRRRLPAVRRHHQR